MTAILGFRPSLPVYCERLDLDMTILGSSNVFDLDFESDDNTFNWEITGDSNNLNDDEGWVIHRL